jgi:hypothetical protein
MFRGFEIVVAGFVSITGIRTLHPLKKIPVQVAIRWIIHYHHTGKMIRRKQKYMKIAAS